MLPGYNGNCATYFEAVKNEFACTIRNMNRSGELKHGHESLALFIWGILATLVHEMLYAYLFTYTCICSEPCLQEFKSQVWYGHMSNSQLAAGSPGDRKFWGAFSLLQIELEAGGKHSS